MPYTTPPATPDYISALTAWITGLITANAFITNSLRLKANNVNTNLSGIPYSGKVTAQAGDRPYFTITTPSQRVINRNAMPTFSNVKSATCDIVISKEIIFQITVEWDGLDENQPNQFMEVMEAILLADPTLGFTGIPIRVSGQYTQTQVPGRTTVNPGGSGQSRPILIQTIRFPVTVDLHRANLVANAAYTGT